MTKTQAAEILSDQECDICKKSKTVKTQWLWILPEGIEIRLLEDNGYTWPDDILAYVARRKDAPCLSREDQRGIEEECTIRCFSQKADGTKDPFGVVCVADIQAYWGQR